MSVIYHITQQTNWEAAKAKGFYDVASLQDEGFIHCSEANQVDGVLERYYKGVTQLVILSVETEKLTSQLIYDWSPSLQQTFPHVYGPINIESVVAVEKIGEW